MIYGNKQEVMIHVYTYCVDTIIQLRNTPSVSMYVRTYIREDVVTNRMCQRKLRNCCTTMYGGIPDEGTNVTRPLTRT